MADQSGLIAALKEVVAQTAPKRDVPSFNGSTNVKHWILIFKAATATRTEEQKISIMMQSMQGAAQSWFCATKLADDAANKTATIAEWEERLIQFFGKTQEGALDELESRRQREGEDAISYVREVLRLCADVDPAMTDATKLRHLKRGLLPRYSHDMLLMDPRDPASFQEKLVRVMAATTSKQEEPDITRALLSSLVAMAEQKSAPAMAAQAAPAADLASITAALQQLTTVLTSQAGLPPQPQAPRQIICFNCRQPGHMNNYCPEPRRQNPPRAPARQQQAGAPRASENSDART